MSRGVTSGFAAACLSGHFRPFELIDLYFSSGTSYLCGLDYAVTYGGVSYTPALGLLNISDIEETDTSAQGLELTISGVGASARGMAMAERVQGRLIRLRAACLDSAGAVQVDDAVWIGAMDTMSLTVGAKSDTITIRAEHLLSTWNRPRTVRYTDAQQQAISPGDLGLQYVSQMESAEIVWPSRNFFLK